MTRIAGELLRDIEKETIDWRPNYDGTRTEPVVLPSAIPSLLINGTLGIAVGMATNIPPHHLGEVVDATIHLIDNKDATTEDLLEHITGPDFPTGGIAFNQKDIKEAYANGKGGVVVRGHADIAEDKKGVPQIVITSLPYRVNKADFVARIADLYRDKKIEGIKDLRDESTDDIRVVIDLKSGTHPQKTLNALYKYTSLEETFHYNMVGLIDGVPQTLSLKSFLEVFVDHRKEVVTRRATFDLNKAKDREHILLGLSKALQHIEEIIALIKKAKDADTARTELMKQYKFSERQAQAILDMKLQRLAGLERKKIEDELTEVQKLIIQLETLLKSEKKILGVAKDELIEIKKIYNDERRTTIVKGGVKELNVEDLIPNEENVLVLTSGGYIKRTNPKEYRTQKRGGVGVVDLSTKDDDFVTRFLTAHTHSDVLFFTDRGKVYQTKMYEIPEGRRATRGKSVMNFLSLASDEHVTSVLAMPKGVAEDKRDLLMVTKHGMAKKVATSSFADVRRNGLIAITLKGDDELVAARFLADDDDAVVVTEKGKAIRFKEKDIRTMGRTAMGVRAIKLGKGDNVVAAEVVVGKEKDAELLVITEKGYGKKTKLAEFRAQKRGGTGVKAAQVTDKTGSVMAASVIANGTSEVVAASKKGQVVRTKLAEIPVQGRITQGVRIMKLRAGDAIASLGTL